MTPELLKSILHYDPDTGIFTWKIKRKKVFAGDVAGGVRGEGYHCIQYAGRVYRAHRLAHLYMTGEWPTHLIDHVNGDRLDNRWENLRPATRTQNNINCATYSNNKSGLKGVKSCNDGKFEARICVNGKQMHLGRFASAQEAHDAYWMAAKEHFGDFARKA